MSKGVLSDEPSSVSIRSPQPGRHYCKHADVVPEGSLLGGGPEVARGDSDAAHLDQQRKRRLRLSHHHLPCYQDQQHVAGY